MTNLMKSFLLSSIICLSTISVISCGGGSGGDTSSTSDGSSGTSGDSGSSSSDGSWIGTWSLTSVPASTLIVSGAWTISSSSSITGRSTYDSVRVLVWDTVVCTWTGSVAVDTDTYTETVAASGFACIPSVAPVTDGILNAAPYSFSDGGNLLTTGSGSEPWVWEKM